jgi:hypothetical protein
MKAMADNTLQVMVPFTCQMEIHDRKEFQLGGHFVSGAGGGEGDYVYILTLTTPDQTAQVARVQSTSKELVLGLIEECIRNTLFAAARNTTLTAMNWDAHMVLVEQVGRLSQHMLTNYGAQAGPGQRFRDVVDQAVHYLRPAWHVRVWRRMVRGRVR